MPGLVQIRAAYVHTYGLETVQTIIAEVENMEDTERLAMMRNMIHLNQVPPTIMANMDSTKYRPHRFRNPYCLIANCYCDGFLTLVSRSLLNAGASR